MALSEGGHRDDNHMINNHKEVETMKLQTVLKAARIVATHRSTYRFLAVLLVALGAAQGASMALGIEGILCAVLGGCVD